MFGRKRKMTNELLKQIIERLDTLTKEVKSNNMSYIKYCEKPCDKNHIMGRLQLLEKKVFPKGYSGKTTPNPPDNPSS